MRTPLKTKTLWDVEGYVTDFHEDDSRRSQIQIWTCINSMDSLNSLPPDHDGRFSILWSPTTPRGGDADGPLGDGSGGNATAFGPTLPSAGPCAPGIWGDAG